MKYGHTFLVCMDSVSLFFALHLFHSHPNHYYSLYLPPCQTLPPHFDAHSFSQLYSYPHFHFPLSPLPLNSVPVVSSALVSPALALPRLLLISHLIVLDLLTLMVVVFICLRTLLRSLSSSPCRVSMHSLHIHVLFYSPPFKCHSTLLHSCIPTYQIRHSNFGSVYCSFLY